MDSTGKSKLISLVLRHKPEAIGIELDEHGWANVYEMLAGLKITMAELEYIVDTDDKQRYSFNEDKTLIRANQGHSLNVDVELEEKEPPKQLYHGTGTRFIKSILESGLNKQSRQYVHLSESKETAIKVGTRHGEPRVLSIDTTAMLHDGYKFYQSKNGVWLTNNVPVNYINEEK